uniref:Uncharacterized protein n=1 Tax=Salix viminalis TaxID=40686 RepID=A0A6N2K6T2_SALVM
MELYFVGVTEDSGLSLLDLLDKEEFFWDFPHLDKKPRKSFSRAIASLVIKRKSSGKPFIHIMMVSLNYFSQSMLHFVKWSMKM